MAFCRGWTKSERPHGVFRVQRLHARNYGVPGFRHDIFLIGISSSGTQQARGTVMGYPAIILVTSSFLFRRLQTSSLRIFEEMNINLAQANK
jgi:hypothetical protein